MRVKWRPFRPWSSGLVGWRRPTDPAGQVRFYLWTERLKKNALSPRHRPGKANIFRGHSFSSSIDFQALRLLCLPSYAPDRNPDKLVWKHLKADTVGRMVVTDRADFMNIFMD
jgi:hypothetical protein